MKLLRSCQAGMTGARDRHIHYVWLRVRRWAKDRMSLEGLRTGTDRAGFQQTLAALADTQQPPSQSAAS
jgi:hypothetical protein